MKDPTRIPRILEELRATWEGQPDLELATLFGILQNRGIGWGTDDATLVEALRELRHRRPPRVEDGAAGRFIVDTTGPECRVMIDPHRVVVRRPGPSGAFSQPGVWEYSGIIRCEVGSPLLIDDREEVRHRLGVVTGIERVSDHPLRQETSLGGLTRELLDDRVLLIRVEDGTSVVVSRSLSVFTPTRRAVDHARHPWTRLITVTPGEPLVIEQPTGLLELGPVTECFFLEG